MAALAVDQHERVIRGEAAQTGGPNDTRRVPHRLGIHVEGRDDGAQQVVQVGVALFDEVARRDGVDGDGGLGGGAGAGAAPDRDQTLQRQGRFAEFDVELEGPAVGDGDFANLGRVTDQRDLDGVGPGGDAGDLVVAVRVGEPAHVERGDADLGAGQGGPSGDAAHAAFECALGGGGLWSQRENHHCRDGV